MTSPGSDGIMWEATLLFGGKTSMGNLTSNQSIPDVMVSLSQDVITSGFYLKSSGFTWNHVGTSIESGMSSLSQAVITSGLAFLVFPEIMWGHLLRVECPPCKYRRPPATTHITRPFAGFPVTEPKFCSTFFSFGIKKFDQLVIYESLHVFVFLIYIISTRTTCLALSPLLLLPQV